MPTVPAPETGNPAWRDRRRWWVCGLLLMVTIISYVDRQAISITAPVLAAQFHFSNVQIAAVINAFIVAYMVGQLLAGRFIDRVGAKFGFSVLVAAWSLAAALTSLGSSTLSFGAFRAALGLAEGVNFPGGVKVIAEWFAPRERATAVGIFTSGASIGAILAPPLLAYVIVAFGWQAAFIVTGIPGLIWVFFWRRTYRPAAPADNSAAGPRAPIQNDPIPWTHLVRQRMVWGVFLARLLEEPVSWFYLTWLPIYLRSYRGASITDIGVALIFPFIALDVGYLAGGWISSRLINAGWPISRARKTVMVVSALCMVSGIPAAAADTTIGFVMWGECRDDGSRQLGIEYLYPARGFRAADTGGDRVWDDRLRRRVGRHCFHADHRPADRCPAFVPRGICDCGYSADSSRCSAAHRSRDDFPDGILSLSFSTATA